MRGFLIAIVLMGLSAAAGFVIGQRAERSAIEAGDQLRLNTNIESERMLREMQAADEAARRRGETVPMRSIQLGYVRYVALRGITNSQGVARFAVEGDYSYLFDPTCEVVQVPDGFLTDFASIPAWARIFFNPSNYAEAALTHDWLYANGLRGDQEGRAKADLIFRTALEELGKSGFEIAVLHRAVRWGGGGGYGRPDDFAFYDPQSGSVINNRPRPAQLYGNANDLTGDDRLMFGRTPCITP